MSDIVLKLENISKVYPRYRKRRESLKEAITNSFARLTDKRHHSPGDGFKALDGISFELRRGESLGIIGNNGAGKSTLLKIISEISEPSSGRMHIKGQIASILELGAGFLQELTGEENIYTYGMLLGFSRKQIQAKEDEIVAFSELEGFMQTPLKHYSSGMVMRLAFSIIVHLNQDIMLLDEALTVGDIRFREKCAKKILNLKNEGKTFILVSHNYEEISPLCNRMILLDKGRMMADGEPDEVYTKYRTKSRGSKNNQETEIVIEESALREIIQKESSQLTYEHRFTEGENIFASIEFIRARVCSAQDKGQRPINYNAAIRIELECRLIDKMDSSGLAFNLTDMTGRTVIAHSPFLEKLGTPDDPGQYLFSWELPPKLLNDGVFQVGFALFNENGELVFGPEMVLSFEVFSEKRALLVKLIKYYYPIFPDIVFRAEQK